MSARIFGFSRDPNGWRRAKAEFDREPIEDERAGIVRWSELSEFASADWLRIAGSARPADAWAEYTRVRETP